MSKYGYIRVSSKDQNLDRQVCSMIEQGIPRKNIFWDKQTGKTFNRSGYKQVVKKFKKGDVLFVHTLERFGRNYDEIISNWRHITMVLEVDIVVLDMTPLLDTRTFRIDEFELAGRFLSNIVLHILAFMAESQRERIHQDQMEGIAIAKKKGVRFGRPKKNIDKEMLEKVVHDWRHKKIKCEEAVKMLGISRAHFFNLIKLYNI